jgi:uncharacterized protein
MNGWLVVFAKAPTPGSVKTRLTPPLSPRQASELYRCLLADALDESARAADALGLAPILAVHPAAAVRELVIRAPRGFCGVAQRGADLGGRMAHVGRQAAAAGARAVLMRGSDSPALDTFTLAAALAALETDSLVLCPDRDGGYNLIALAARAMERAPDLFAHPMSTASVLADTLARARVQGLAARVLAPGFDVDRFDDLRWLAAARRRGPGPPCPRTLAFLDEQQLWPGAAR